MISFTNHALDHMLGSVLDANITRRIVRLGGRSRDERVSQYSIENLEMVAGRSRLDSNLGKQHRALKGVEEELKSLMVNVFKASIQSEQIFGYLQYTYPIAFEL